MNKILRFSWIKFYLSIILFILSIFFILPSMQKIIGTQLMVDTTLFISSKDVEAIKSVYTIKQIRGYIINALTLDLIWPIIYSYFLLMMIQFSTRLKSNVRKFSILLLVALISDYLENIFCILVLKEIDLKLAVSISSNLKWISLFILILFILREIIFSIIEKEITKIEDSNKFDL